MEVYDTPLASKLTARQAKDLKTIEQRLTDFLEVKKAPKKQVDAAYETFKRADIRPSAAGTGFTGTPIVAPDEQNKKIGEMSWNDIETMLSGFAYDVYCNRNETSKKNYFTVFDYAIDQGFAFGSGMGTNHHYGYQIRKIYTTAWLMRDEIYKHPLHPYTKGLLGSIPVANPKLARKKVNSSIEGDIPSPINPPTGCRFHTRCPYAKPECAQVMPQMKDMGGGHMVACHLYDDTRVKRSCVSCLHEKA